MNLDAYDDMMGLEFGDYEGMDGVLPNAEQIKEAVIASTAGGGAILLSTYAVKMLAEKVDLSSRIENPLLRSGVMSAATMMVGLIAGKGLYDYNRDAAMGIVGGVGGVAMANFLDAVIAQVTGNEPMGFSLADADESLLSGGYEDPGMEALAALETTGVTTAPGAFQGFADPSVTPEALMGLDGTVVQEETLGGYAPYLS
jgi:hypothetical protein